MENANETTARTLLRVVKEAASEVLDASNYALGKLDQQWAEKALSAPVYRGDNPQPLQRADGTFPFMLGYDTLGGATL